MPLGANRALFEHDSPPTELPVQPRRHRRRRRGTNDDSCKSVTSGTHPKPKGTVFAFLNELFGRRQIFAGVHLSGCIALQRFGRWTVCLLGF